MNEKEEQLRMKLNQLIQEGFNEMRDKIEQCFTLIEHKQEYFKLVEKMKKR